MRVGLNGWFLNQPQVGSGQYIRQLWQGLAQRSDVTCVTFQAQGGDVTVPLHSWGPLAKVWHEQVDLPRAAHGRVDVLHYPYFASPLIKPCPTVVTIHDLIPLLFPEYGASLQVRLYNALIVRAARRADDIIAVSEHTRRDIVQHLGIPAERVHVIYEAPAAMFQPPDDAAVEAVKQRYGLGRYIYYIGGLNRHKNVATLLAAFARLRGAVAERYQLVIAGKAHSANRAVFPDLRPQADDLGLTWSEGAAAKAVDVRFLGFVPEEEKPALYGGAELFVYPSLYEGFGFCPLEAMACGTPVVCSRAASLPEICGDAGLLVEPMDVQAMARAMASVLGDPALAGDLRARGLRRAACFSWARVAEETVAVYRSVLARR